MLSSDYNDVNSVQEQQNMEAIIDKHSRFVFLVPIVALLISIISTKANFDRRIIGACWIIFGVLLYHFAIERRELYYYRFSKEGITQYNLFTTKQRKIPWSQIVQIGIRSGRFTTGMLVITILGAPKWNQKKKGSDQAWYYLSNRPNVLILEKWRPAQNIIQTYYGPLDY